MAEETKETKKIIPESKKKHKRNIKEKSSFESFCCLFVVGRNRLVYFWGKGYEA